MKNVLVALILSMPLVSHSRVLSQAELLRRCYSHLTGQVLPLKSPLKNRLANGETSIQICVSIMNEVQLAPTGALVQTNNNLHRRILTQFQDLHKSWIQAQYIKEAELLDFEYATPDLYDPSEPSLFFTRAAFTNGLSVATVLNSGEGLEALRDSTKVTDAYAVGKFLRPSKMWLGDVTGTPLAPFLDNPVITYQKTTLVTTGTISKNELVESEMNFGLIQVGELYGVRPRTDTVMTPQVWLDVFTPEAKEVTPGLIVPFNLRKHFGAGAIGSQPYILMNLGHGHSYKANGTTKLPRKWFQAVMKDFLCRSTPAVRDSDVASYIRPAMTGSAPFRQAESCVKCHSTMDQAASTLRNLRMGTTARGENPIYKRIPAFMAEYTVSQGPPAGQEAWPVTNPGNFHFQAPTGKLYFRDTNGVLIDQQVLNLAQLGAALAQSDDFYRCTVKRYFEYFTGISINLYDPGDPLNADVLSSQTDSEKNYRDFIYSLATKLKTNGSSKEAINAILNSKYYTQSDYGKGN